MIINEPVHAVVGVIGVFFVFQVKVKVTQKKTPFKVKVRVTFWVKVSVWQEARNLEVKVKVKRER